MATFVFKTKQGIILGEGEGENPTQAAKAAGITDYFEAVDAGASSSGRREGQFASRGSPPSEAGLPEPPAKTRSTRKDKGGHHVKQVSKAPPKRVRSKAGFSLVIGAVAWYPDKATLEEALGCLLGNDFAQAIIIPGKPLKPICHKGYSFDEI